MRRLEPSKSDKCSNWREKSEGSGTSHYWERNSDHNSWAVGSSNRRDQKEVAFNRDGSRYSQSGLLSPRNTRQPTLPAPENMVKDQPSKLFHHGVVLSVNHEKCFGFLAPIDEGTVNNVYFKVSKAGDQLTSTSTGGMLLIPGDVMEYRLANCDDNRKFRALSARLSACKPRKNDELVKYVKNLVTTAEEYPEIVLRDVTKCPAGFKLVLDYHHPSNELLKNTLELCQILRSSKLAELYHSRLKQMYALFSGSRFLVSKDGVQKCVTLSASDGDESLVDLVEDFLIHLLEYIPSQLPLIFPVLKLVSGEVSESFLTKVLKVLAGGSNGKPGSRLWSQLPLLPTMKEVRLLNRDRSTLPVVKQKGGYISPDDYVETYLRLLREDCFAGLLQGIQALREGRVNDCDLKLWFQVSTVGAHFNHNSSPGLTFAVMLPHMKGEKSPEAPLGGSLVCFFDDGGGFDLPIWGVVSRCEEDANKSCICFVEIIDQGGIETELSSTSLSALSARIIIGQDMVMAQSPTYYRAYQPVLEALQLTDPHSIPFKEELVFVTWPDEPAPEYLKSDCATLDWSCIFDPAPLDLDEVRRNENEQRSTSKSLIQLITTKKFQLDAGFDAHTPASSEIREGVGAVESLLKRGFTTSFDPSQLKAVELALNNRLTIIQGPPGTGKTYIGVKLLQLLLSASTFPQESPVFVITYKNHALDQFLEKCLKTFCREEDIVRVGGRSQNKNLETCNLHNRMTRDDEFRFDSAENFQNMKEINEELKDALLDINRSLLKFDPLMILVHAPELQLNYFLKEVAHPSRIDSCVIRLPEGLTLAEVIQGQIPENADQVMVADVRDFKERLITEIGRWIPRPGVLQSVQELFSVKRPSSITNSQPNVFYTEGDEQDEGRNEEDERRSTYESLRQDINYNLDDLFDLDADKSKRTSYQWLVKNFMEFPKEKDIHGTSVAYRRLNLDSSTEMGSQFDWLAYENPYLLSTEHRAILVYKYWQKSVEAACERLVSIKARYDMLLQDTEQIRERRQLAILRKAKIIAMTTTGAAIHRSVLKHLTPAVVLVEEAAEILEPQVLASLNTNLQHLILIGDHHQLRPQVESYDLERWHGFGVSMFERLVEHNKLPYQPLGLQCRMREEFLPMLLPIYPFLKSHTALVSGDRNKAPTCMVHTMHFWSHEYEETSQRSYVNQEEAHMVVALARWFVSELEDCRSLKILAAYNGQVTLIRKLLKQYSEMEGVQVYSIDSFQGAESEIVIVSLVRSNAEGKIGHLSMRNRLCVAASRARCGIYFVGNHTTLTKKSAHWSTLINHFEGQNAIHSTIPLCCPRHPNRPPYALSNTAASIFKPCDVCDYPCQNVLPCGHVCSFTCHFGVHSQCKELVDFTFCGCGHSQTKMCCEDEVKLSCKTKVIHKFRNCEHSTKKKCWELKGSRKLNIKCQIVCGKELKCGHVCKLRCSEDCESAPCEACQEIEKAKEKIKLQILIKAIKRKKKELDVEIQKLKERGDEGIVITQLHRDGDTAQAYYMAKDRAEMFTQPDCKAVLVVTKVEKIENLPLQAKFLEAQKDLLSPLEIPEWLFYGGIDNLLDLVVTEGFGAAHQKGYLFDVYSSRISQKHGNHKLLLCEVNLGKTWRSSNVDKDMNQRILNEKGYDSLSVIEGQQNEGELRPFAHIVFNPDQAVPRFIVSYKLVDFEALAEANGFGRYGERQASKSGGMCRLPLEPSLNFEGDSPEEYHFRMAESQFFRMSKNRKMKVTKVEFVKNTALEERFNKMKEEFKSSKVPSDARFVFHGTDSNAIDKIATEGFKIGGTEGVAIRVGAVYGHGVYTAVNPDVSLWYSKHSNMMLMSLAIPGELNTHHGLGSQADVLVIKNVSQLLPRYVVHFSAHEEMEHRV